MTVYLLGGSGLLGSCFRKYSSNKIVSVGRAKSDNDIIIDRFTEDAFLNLIRPGDSVVHMAWPTNLSLCEIFDFSILYEESGKLFKYCQKRDIPFIYISSDQVYDKSLTLHKETDKCNPVNMYGKSKLICEQLAIEHGGTVARLNYLTRDYDSKGRGWLETLRKNIEQNKKQTFLFKLYFLTMLWQGCSHGYREIN